ncbi:MAG: hypothetical protein JWN41_1044 [Thermoleophilia bacterium]|nr:hypothetical protein [Thermoleophilia bacterium]
MRRLLTIATLFALLVGTTVGVAWANVGPTSSAVAARAVAAHSSSTRGALNAPVTPPTVHHADGTASYRRISQIATAVAGAESSATPSAPSSSAVSASASITVTATVLPAITVQLGADGAVQSIITNTHERSAVDVVYLVRHRDGTAARPTPAIWSDVRQSLAHARAGVGTIWSR